MNCGNFKMTCRTPHPESTNEPCLKLKQLVNDREISRSSQPTRDPLSHVWVLQSSGFARKVPVVGMKTEESCPVTTRWGQVVIGCQLLELISDHVDTCILWILGFNLPNQHACPFFLVPTVGFYLKYICILLGLPGNIWLLSCDNLYLRGLRSLCLLCRCVHR